MSANHIRQQRNCYFSGPVLDGPFEGDWMDADGEYNEVYWQRNLIPAVYSYTGDLPSASFELERALYKWLHGYRAWAFIPRLK